MQLGDRLEDAITFRVIDGYYDVVEDGHDRPTPVIHLFGRDSDDQWRHVIVDDYRPYFYVASEELDRRAELAESLGADRRVLGIETDCRDGLDPSRVNESTDLTKIVVESPYNVSDLRDHFQRHWEADVRFIQRFLVDMGVRAFMRVEPISDRPDGSVIASQDGVRGVESDDIDIAPRVCTFDIEVFSETDGPAIVSKSGTERAANPVTAITAHDSFTDEYMTFVPRHEEWDVSELDLVKAIDGVVDIFDRESELLEQFCAYVRDTHFDVLTGWNCQSFDVPYLVNRCFEKEVWTIREWSPTGDVSRCDGDGSWINSDVKGIHVFDLLDGFKKTNYRNLKSNSLENVAAEVTDIEKLDIADELGADVSGPEAIDYAWQHDPVTFVEYSHRDVQATVAINQSRSIL